MNKRAGKILFIMICFAFLVVVTVKGIDRLQNAEKTITESEERTNEGLSSEEMKETEQGQSVEKLLRNPELRVLIKNDDFMSDIHAEVRLTSNRDFQLRSEEGTLFAEYPAWEEVNLDAFQLKSGENLVFESEGKMVLSSLKRAQGNPMYYGKLQIYKEEQGYTVINIVPMEDYLRNVVPSEMPSSYPLEALKAQAVCARSYAYYYYLNASGLPHDANMSDSTEFQVYNNIQETEITNQAIAQTEGMLLLNNKEPVPTYFFSTSCGFTTNETIWKEYFEGKEFAQGENPTVVHRLGEMQEEKTVAFQPVTVAETQAVETISTDSGLGILYNAFALRENQNFEAYIQSDDADFLESQEPWYRWTYAGEISSERIKERLRSRYAVRPDLILTLEQESGDYVNQDIEGVGNITGIEVIKRLDGGVADELLIETTQNTFLIIGEYNIRYVLSDESSDIIRKDGSVIPVASLLPSAYFIIEPERTSSGVITGIVLHGGGYGHGVGMSQNGAKHAAESGMDYKEILALFYQKLELSETE